MIISIKKYRTLLIAVVAWVAIVPPTRAQFLCTVTENASIGLNGYWYSALSCKGNDCTVSALSLYSNGTAHLAFLRSLDGGLTWTVQDPGIDSGDWTQMPYITTIDQIDSLNVVAFGDSNLIVRTNDGGVTWQQLALPTKRPIIDISFANAMDGFLVVADTVDTTFITSDGGLHWEDPAPFRTKGGAARCHDYGQGMYRLFSYYYGQVYTTTDNWKTIDSTGPIISDSAEAIKYGFARCSFGTGDTMLAYGNHFNSKGAPYPCIARTTDGGHHWSSVLDDSTGYRGAVSHLSDVNRDTIIAVGSANVFTVFWSTDNAVTWRRDTVICKDTTFNGAMYYGIGLNSSGEIVAASSLYRANSTLTIGRHVSSDVASRPRDLALSLYPNPATSSITVTGGTPHREVHLLDLLGREALRSIIPEDGPLTLDVSHLPRGMYEVMIERHGQMIPAGKLALIGK